MANDSLNLGVLRVSGNQNKRCLRLFCAVFLHDFLDALDIGAGRINVRNRAAVQLGVDRSGNAVRTDDDRNRLLPLSGQFLLQSQKLAEGGNGNGTLLVQIINDLRIVDNFSKGKQLRVGGAGNQRELFIYGIDRAPDTKAESGSFGNGNGHNSFLSVWGLQVLGL